MEGVTMESKKKKTDGLRYYDERLLIVMQCGGGSKLGERFMKN